jgi:hypothetical protein
MKSPRLKIQEKQKKQRLNLKRKVGLILCWIMFSELMTDPKKKINLTQRNLMRKNQIKRKLQKKKKN